MKRKIIMLILFLSMNLISCGLSQDVLVETSSNYKNALEALCTEYGLDDASVMVESDFSTKSDDGKTRVDRAIIKSDKFRNLSAEKAFKFAKDVLQLQYECEYDDGTYSLLFSTTIKSDDNSYHYESEYIMGKKFEYLMGYGKSYVTYVDSTMTYNIWD